MTQIRLEINIPADDPNQAYVELLQHPTVSTPIYVMDNPNATGAEWNGSLSDAILCIINDNSISTYKWYSSSAGSYATFYLPPPITQTWGCTEIKSNASQAFGDVRVEIFNTPFNTGTVNFFNINPGQTIYCEVTENGTADDFVTTPCCIRGDAVIQTSEGPMRIQDIGSDSQERGLTVRCADGSDVPVRYVIRHIVPTGRFCRIPADSLGMDMPAQDLYLTPEHPVQINGQEVEARDLDIVETVESEPVQTFTLCTENRCAVLTNGVPVMTWAQADWEGRSKTDIWTKN